MEIIIYGPDTSLDVIVKVSLIFYIRMSAPVLSIYLDSRLCENFIQILREYYAVFKKILSNFLENLFSDRVLPYKQENGCFDQNNVIW